MIQKKKKKHMIQHIKTPQDTILYSKDKIIESYGTYIKKK